MFKCQVTGKVSRSGEKALKLVIKSRSKVYYGPAKDEEGNTILDGITGEVVLNKIGEGKEIVKELTVTQEGYDQYMGMQNGQNS